ncbi:MAG: DUF192 domain-containing protein [Salinivenus sp.]
MIRSFLLVAVATLLLISVGCGTDDSSPDAPSDTATTIPFDREGELVILQDRDSLVTLDLEVADTDSARERGMMQRDGFPNETSGMLFPFDAEEERSFWMANTPVALDLFFIDADSQIVRIARYARPNSSDPIESKDPAQYVLETPAGFADSYGVLEGDRVRWKRTDDGE